jgi:hypothetical protein
MRVTYKSRLIVDKYVFRKGFLDQSRVGFEALGACPASSPGEGDELVARDVRTASRHPPAPARASARGSEAIVAGWPHANLRDLVPDRILAAHPDLYVGDHSVLAPADAPPRLPA